MGQDKSKYRYEEEIYDKSSGGGLKLAMRKQARRAKVVKSQIFEGVEYTRSKVLGKGGQGTTWLYVEYDANGKFKRFVAGKEIEIGFDYESYEDIDEKIKREVLILQMMKA